MSAIATSKTAPAFAANVSYQDINRIDYARYILSGDAHIWREPTVHLKGMINDPTFCAVRFVAGERGVDKNVRKVQL